MKVMRLKVDGQWVTLGVCHTVGAVHHVTLNEDGRKVALPSDPRVRAGIGHEIEITASYVRNNRNVCEVVEQKAEKKSKPKKKAKTDDSGNASTPLAE